MALEVPERYRITEGFMGTTAADGNNGAFYVPVMGKFWNVMVGDGAGWEHVSISRPHETPSWAVMCAIKALFWSPEDCVIQYHPAKSEYVNCHPHCLHLWRPVGVGFPIPPAYLVGPK